MYNTGVLGFPMSWGKGSGHNEYEAVAQGAVSFAADVLPADDRPDD